jgi:hypothetical protein
MMKPMRTLAIAVEEIPSCDFRKTGSVSGQIVAITWMHKKSLQIHRRFARC